MTAERSHESRITSHEIREEMVSTVRRFVEPEVLPVASELEHRERFNRDAPLMIIGEGTNEIQRLVIARQLLQRYKI